MLRNAGKVVATKAGPWLTLSQRTFATQHHEVVDLDYTKFSPDNAKSSKPPLVICHGLFGSKQNWKSLARAFTKRLNTDVYTLDMRNHGDSPHNKVHTYNAMGDDLAAFLKKQGIDDSILMGHSMGGKAVMNMCLRDLNPVSKLIVVDMAPAVLPLSSDFGSYVKAMDEIQKANLTKRSDADKILAQTEPDIGIRQFLLTNLKKDEQTGLYKFRVPYDILGKSLGKMSDFMEEETQPFEKPTLFIAGGNSGYIKPEKNGPAIKRQFPHSSIKVIKGAGHWVPTPTPVHAEKPEEFVNVVTEFVGSQ
ncbi:hypothetical protein INT43_006499 [Umbelopsis isabellina]|uniref:AB hydrolase-1 domain-containing protein n=1 Tax=Mortierella isabellina TaxID=91625 RepID=A0A8H7Q176_MORIS|nr:hypothetical protein INT43_006499 [Umbelopsis isabellina]